MTKHTHARWTPTIQQLSLGTLCAALAFTVGLETAGDVHPFDTSEAAGNETVMVQRTSPKGDMDGDGFLSVEDAILLLEFGEGYETATPRELHLGDMDGDLRLTTRDALRVLHILSDK